ncbi:effector-associated domain 2-containing protein [Dactylosporangium sp. CA-233914]|uniref:VMAP-C domain-containing protein n=1 Tax=Dactylosporangium sp. CA-233914 TaxID=3239934 RepID=UPI003D8C4C9C
MLGDPDFAAMAEALAPLADQLNLPALRGMIREDLDRLLGYKVDAPRAEQPRLSLLFLLKECRRFPGALHTLAEVLQVYFPGDPAIAAFQAELRAVPEPLLQPGERRRLLRLAERAARVPIAGAYRAAVGPVGPERPEGLRSAGDVMMYLEGLLLPKDSPPQLLTFVAALAAEADAELRAELRAWLEAHLARRGAPAEWLAALTPVAARGSRTILVVQIEQDWVSAGYTVSAWFQAEDGTPGVSIAAGEEVVAEEGLPAEIDRHLNTILTSYAYDANDVLVEFILPKALFNLPVDQWPVGPAFRAAPLELGVRHPVVVRSWDRGTNPALRPYWNTKSKRLRAHGHLTDAKAVYCLDRPEPNLSALGSELWEEPRICFMQEFAPSETPSLDADELGVAVTMGLPVAVWCRPGFDPQTAGRLDEVLDVSSVAELPGLVHRLRREAVRGHDQHPQPGRHLALLWDEFGRWPEEPADQWKHPTL